MFCSILNMPWIWICHGCKYAELHMIVNNISHHRYLTGFWICLKFLIRRRYIGFSPSYIFDRFLSIPWALVLGLKYIGSGIWIYHGFQICQGSEYARVLNMPQFWICSGNNLKIILNPMETLKNKTCLDCIWPET